MLNYLCVQTSINLEPVSFIVWGGVEFDGLPSIHLGTELAGECAPTSMDYEVYYSSFHCPKVKMEAAVSRHVVNRPAYVGNVPVVKSSSGQMFQWSNVPVVKCSSS
jgi:hypothetical protein